MRQAVAPSRFFRQVLPALAATLLALACGGKSSRSPAPAPPVISSFTATPSTLAAPGNSTLAWTVSGSTALTISGLGPVTGSSVVVTPSATTTYTLTATNAAGPSTASCTVTVTGSLPSAPPHPYGPDAVGGGLLQGGLAGDYFPNATLDGTPQFSRRDVRVDFDWGSARPVGGSTYAPLRAFPRDNFSVRWTGQFIPRFGEATTFQVATSGGARLKFRPAGSGAWTSLIDQWNAPGAFSSAPQTLVAGATYDLQLEYHHGTGPALCRLVWSSPSLPAEVLNPVTQQGLNTATWSDFVWADQVRGARWSDTANLDENEWPRGDKEFVLGERNGQDTELSGTYALSFQGRAHVATGCCNASEFTVNGQSYGTDLPAGVGYSAATNTTTALLRSDGSRLFPSFSSTSRDGVTAGSGITGLKLMRPIAPGSPVPHDPTEVVYRPFKNLVSTHYTCLRWLGAANLSLPGTWATRNKPSDAFFVKADPALQQENWEYLVMLANETGKDLYLALPVNADDACFQKLANLVCYGSDGDQPYTSLQASPLYPPLNPNLHLYVEVGNEIWNWAFDSTAQVLDTTRAEAAAHSPLWQVLNFDGSLPAAGDSLEAMRRWLAVRTVACSNAFRAVFGDGAMGSRIRLLTEYQYNNEQATAEGSFRMLDAYFNNGTGTHVASPHPANYYLWGAGGATYYATSNTTGDQTAILVPDGGFEAPVLPDGTLRQNPTGSAWTFTGKAGIYHQEGTAAIPPLGAPMAPPEGHQAAYLLDDGEFHVTVAFPAAGDYAITFNGAHGSGDSEDQFDLFFDSTLISPKSQDDDRVAYAGDFAGLGGWARDLGDLHSVWGSAVFHVAAPGNHTLSFRGRGQWGNTTGNFFFLFDNIQIASADAILNSGFGSGQAAGQVADADYQAQLNNQAIYARLFGLEVVAYEAGWSLGGDFTQRPIQNWCKLHDPRARTINDRAEDIFRLSGSAMNVWGVYTYLPTYGLGTPGAFPLMQSLEALSARLPLEATNGTSVPATLTEAGASWFLPRWSYGGDAGDSLGWLILTPQFGRWGLTLTTTAGGAFEVEWDGRVVGTLTPSGGTSQTFIVEGAPRGPHAIRFRTRQGQARVTQLVVTRE